MTGNLGLVTPGLPVIGAPATRAFQAAGISTLDDVTKWTEQDLLALHGVGPRAVRTLRAAMEPLSLDFKAQ